VVESAPFGRLSMASAALTTGRRLIPAGGVVRCMHVSLELPKRADREAGPNGPAWLGAVGSNASPDICRPLIPMGPVDMPTGLRRCLDVLMSAARRDATGVIRRPVGQAVPRFDALERPVGIGNCGPGPPPHPSRPVGYACPVAVRA
jgi:hypothetical protein